MNKEIERIYVGLPEYLKDKVIWVTRSYRTNELSHIPGGEDIVIEYQNGTVYGYDWVKNPCEYIKNIDAVRECWVDSKDNDILGKEFDVNLFKTKVSGIYYREYVTEHYKTVQYVMVWDAEKDNISPQAAIGEYRYKQLLNNQ